MMARKEQAAMRMLGLGAALCLAACGASGSALPDGGESGPSPATGDAAVPADGGVDVGPASSAGTLDPSYGTGGKLLTAVGCPRGLIPQADQGFLLSLSSAKAVLARIGADGALVPTFGTGGLAAPPDPSSYFINWTTNPVVLADGRIIVAGAAHPHMGTGKPSLTRYLADGRLDTGFGTNGLVVLDVDTGDSPNTMSLVPIPGGQLLLVGMPGVAQGGEGPFLARVDVDGRLDTGFGTHGWTVPKIGDWSTWDVALQADGKIVLAGSVRAANKSDDFAVLRLTADGARDPSFAGSGLVTAEFAAGANDTAMSVLIQPDGKIVAGGMTACLGPICPFDFAVVRYLADGNPDPTFGDHGRLVVRNGGAHTLALLPGGGLLLGGASAEDRVVELGGGWGRASPQTFGLARLDPAGAFDAHFGGEGVVRTSFGDDLTRASIDRFFVQPDGKVLAAGCVGAFAGGDDHLGLARYLP